MKALTIVNAVLYVVSFWYALKVGFGWWDAGVVFDTAYAAALAAAAVFGWFAVAFLCALLPLLTAKAKNQNAEVTAYFRDTFAFPGMAALCLAIAFGVRSGATLYQTPPLLAVVAMLAIAGSALIAAGIIVEDWLAKPRPTAAPDATT